MSTHPGGNTPIQKPNIKKNPRGPYPNPPQGGHLGGTRPGGRH